MNGLKVRVGSVGLGAVCAGALWVGSGAAARPIPKACRPVDSGGSKFAVLTTGSDCDTARALIGGLAKVKVPQGQYYHLADKALHLTKYKDWRCLGAAPPGQLSVRIACQKGSVIISGLGGG